MNYLIQKSLSVSYSNVNSLEHLISKYITFQYNCKSLEILTIIAINVAVQFPHITETNKPKIK